MLQKKNFRASGEIILTIVLFFITSCIFSQNIDVKSFKVLPKDQTARVHEPVIDQNGEKCALIKVVTNQTGFAWEGGTLGITKVKKKTGEYWVYVPYGSEKITIKHDELGILRNYVYPEAIKKATVYEMVLTTGDVKTVVEENKIATQWLIIKSEPKEANVFIDGKLAGKTNFQRKYEEGEYTYRIEKSRYHNKAGKITLKDEKKQLEFTLKPRFGNIKVTSSPKEGMKIYLDEENTNQETPATLKEVSSGEHTIKLQSRWYQPETKKVTVEDEQTTTVNFALDPAFAKITVKTTPAAEILVDGERKGTAEWEGRLMEGIYTIKAEKDKYHSQSEQMEVTAGQDETVNFDLKGKTGNADIVTTPMDAAVYVNGEKKGTSPLTLDDLLIGEYTLKLQKEGYGTVTKTIKIKEDESITVEETLPDGKEVTLTSTPEGAKVYIDGKLQGNTPLQKTLSFGTHNIKMINGEQVVNNKIDISQSGKEKIEFDVSEFENFTLDKKGISIDMIAVEGGTYRMGCTEEQSNCDDDEKPAHSVTVDDFTISKYEITNRQFADFMNAIDANRNGSYNGTEYLDMDDRDCQINYRWGQFEPESGKENHPVIKVTWYGAKAFCEYYGGRLPTEAEWEFAARGGNSATVTEYAGSDNIDEVAWYSGNSGEHTHEVGTKSPNELGIYDMSGNVYEWCNDWYDNDYYSSSPRDNPQGPEGSKYKVLRGGSWNYSANDCRVAVRDDDFPSYPIGDVGFRVAAQ